MSTESFLQVYDRVQDLGVLCPICAHPDWCAIRKDRTAAACQRVPSAVRDGDRGYVHPLTDYQLPKNTDTSQPPPVQRDWNRIHKQYWDACSPWRCIKLANILKVSHYSLEDLGCGWNGESWTFPISICDGICSPQIVGIQRRYPDGSKRTMKGSKLGLHIPSNFRYGKLVWIAEGASDTASLLDFGCNAVGRLSCSSGRKQAAELCRGVPVIIIGDHGHPNEIRGAQQLQRELDKCCPKTVLWFPPAKDFRDWRADVGDAVVKQQLVELMRRIDG